MKRMSMRRFAEIVRRVMRTLPEQIARHLDNVVVDVADEPPPELIDEYPDGMYGFFEPMPTGSPEGSDLLDQPNCIWIFKRPLEDDFPDPKRLRVEIRKTVVHEIAHHFGWSDADLERFDDNPDPFDDE